ncbi:acyl-CoA thioesterase II [Nocardioides sp. GY 10113]|uniref:acyl-CoA thioesterase n=1 Tax=Nocardioides sp. GY 10113 TaxID=2569761 RepID=UPI0010A83100|nr:acyl-CoA thioesterase domain-containing protein [Nocardioides sp. GY 10113]TIC86797.1 acyl-CoA thioesterase II [Nocardioides sp. GY 10113]
MTSADPADPTIEPADEPAWTTPMAELLTLLDLAPAPDDRPDVFAAEHARTSVHTGHVFGGLVAAQALVAAARTVEGSSGVRAPHSLHAYFLRAGDATRPLRMEVTRLRDGRSISHRRVSAVQDDRVIMEMTCSFATPQAGGRHQVAGPQAPAPQTLPPDHHALTELLPGREAFASYGTSLDAFELRTVGLGPGWFSTPVPPEEPTLVWKRPGSPVPADPVLHAAVLTYASDMRILHTALRPHARSAYDASVSPATLDHALWFHRPVDANQWMLWRMDSPWAADGRSLTRAQVHLADGTLVASAAQEGFVRYTS